jgi:penicillin-insensitive murein DD-endopeptidase
VGEAHPPAEGVANHVLSAKERESLSAVSVLKKGARLVDPRLFGEAERMLIYRAALLPGVPRIFAAPV